MKYILAFISLHIHASEPEKKIPACAYSPDRFTQVMYKYHRRETDFTLTYKIDKDRCDSPTPVSSPEPKPINYQHYMRIDTKNGINLSAKKD